MWFSKPYPNDTAYLHKILKGGHELREVLPAIRAQVKEVQSLLRPSNQMNGGMMGEFKIDTEFKLDHVRGHIWFRTSILGSTPTSFDVYKIMGTDWEIQLTNKGYRYRGNRTKMEEDLTYIALKIL